MMNQQVFKKMLLGLGFWNVDVAENGHVNTTVLQTADSLQAAVNLVKQKVFWIVFMDIMVDNHGIN